MGAGVGRAVTALRLVAVAAVAVSVVTTLLAVAAPVNPFDFFGYFTIQSNLIAAAALLVAATGSARGVAAAPLLRGAATTYIALTGVVYNTLLTGLEGGIAGTWQNVVLHTAVPIYAVADWVLLPDRPALPWRRLCVVVPYPLVWLAVVLVRGATDGWVPYPFLNPATGYASIAAYCVAITVVVLVLAGLMWLASRLHLGGRVRAAGQRT